MAAGLGSPIVRWRGRVRRSTWLVLALLAGGVVPACIPGWPWGLLFWFLGFSLVLTACIAWHVGCALSFALSGRFRTSAREALQPVVLALSAPLFLPLFALNDAVSFVDRCLTLRAQALALPDDGGPHVSWREGGDNDETQWAWREKDDGQRGLAYDASGQILRPAGLRSPRWRQRVEGSVLAGKCWSAEQIVGPFYRWEGRGCTEDSSSSDRSRQ